MKTIYKYPVPLTDDSILQLPAGAEPLHVGVQNGALFLWALIDTDAELVAFPLHLAGTGHPIEEEAGNLEYIGTAFDGPSVWHVFRVLLGAEPTDGVE